MLWHRSKDPTPSGGAAGSKRPASTEDLVPATTPAVKLHKDASGDIGTAATVTAALPQDTADSSPPAAPAVQVTAAQLAALLAEVQTLSTAVRGFPAQLAASEAGFKQQLQEEKQNNIARETALKDSFRQRIAQLEDTVEFLNQRVRGKNMVLHGIPDAANLSKPAQLEDFVKKRFDDATPSTMRVKPSQAITSVTHIGRPGTGNRSVLVEYSSSQGKHRAYALSRQLRRQGVHLADELTPAQLHAQRAMGADADALRSKGYRPWFRRGTLWYSNRGVPRQCKHGEAAKVPLCSGATPPPGPPPRTSARRPSSPRRAVAVPADVGQGARRSPASRSPSPSYAEVTRTGPTAPAQTSSAPAAPAQASSTPAASTAAPPATGPSSPQ